MIGGVAENADTSTLCTRQLRQPGRRSVRAAIADEEHLPLPRCALQELNQFAPGALQDGPGIVCGKDQTGDRPLLPGLPLARLHATSPVDLDPTEQTPFTPRSS